MSKYIIELGEEANMVQAINVTQNGNVYVNAKYVTELKELTSDYINEHYGQLQQDAYDKGYKDGRNVTETQAHNDAYQRGFEDGKAVNDKGCEGCKYANVAVTHEPCVRCSNSYGNQWTAKDDEIEVGDVVERYLNDKLDSTGIYLGEDGDYWNCLFWTGAVFGTFAYPKNQFKKTEKHVDIASMLEDMRND